MSIEIANEAGADVDTGGLLAVARHTLDQMGVNPLAELSILLVDIDYMTELNHRWMGGDGPTDVLAFPMDEGTIDHGPGESSGGEPALLGDIVLCPEVAAKQAVTAGHPTADELHLLIVHGCLHLLGYDHAEPDEEREMFGLQNRLLEAWRSRGGKAGAAGVAGPLPALGGAGEAGTAGVAGILLAPGEVGEAGAAGLASSRLAPGEARDGDGAVRGELRP